MRSLAADVWTTARRDLAAIGRRLDIPVALVRENALLWISRGPTADFNLVALESAADAPAVLREFAAGVRAAGVPAVFMLSGASSAELSPVARDEGLSEAGAAPLMLLRQPHQPLRPSAFGIERLIDPVRLGAVADLIASAFGLDRDWVERTFAAPALLGASGVRFAVATRDGEVCSTVTTTFTAPGPVGIWSMATAPQTQRQGAGRAVLEAAMQQHLSEGRESFYLIATPAGKSLYDSLGFETVDELALWTLGHSEQFGDH